MQLAYQQGWPLDSLLDSPVDSHSRWSSKAADTAERGLERRADTQRWLMLSAKAAKETVQKLESQLIDLNLEQRQDPRPKSQEWYERQTKYLTGVMLERLTTIAKTVPLDMVTGGMRNVDSETDNPAVTVPPKDLRDRAHEMYSLYDDVLSAA